MIGTKYLIFPTNIQKVMCLISSAHGFNCASFFLPGDLAFQQKGLARVPSQSDVPSVGGVRGFRPSEKGFQGGTRVGKPITKGTPWRFVCCKNVMFEIIVGIPGYIFLIYNQLG